MSVFSSSCRSVGSVVIMSKRRSTGWLGFVAALSWSLSRIDGAKNSDALLVDVGSGADADLPALDVDLNSVPSSSPSSPWGSPSSAADGGELHKPSQSDSFAEQEVTVVADRKNRAGTSHLALQR